MPTTATTSKLSFLAQLGFDLAAISPDGFMIPSPMPDGVVPVGVVNDDARRLFTLYGARISAYNAKVTQYNKLDEQIFSAVDLGVRNLIQGGLDASILDEHEQLAKELPVDRRVLELVRDQYWAEVRHQYPVLNDKALIGVYAGWNACWHKQPEDRVVVIGGEGLPPEFLGYIEKLLGGAISLRRAA